MTWLKTPLLALALLAIVPRPAIADTITKFQETWSDVGVITIDQNHYAGIVVQDKLNDTLAASFQFKNGPEWNKFVALWKSPKTTPGRLKDVAGDTLMVDLDDDGLVEISVAAPAQPGDPQLFCDFHLQKKDVAAFDKRVQEVSDFFSKPSTR
jgi:hypothetical protein